MLFLPVTTFVQNDVEIGGAREDARHADDRDVDGAALANARRFGEVDVVEGIGTAVADVFVELVDRAARASERRDLAEHEHPLGVLCVVAQRHERAPLPDEPLRRDAEAAEVHLLERFPDRLRVFPLGFEPRTLALERGDVCAVGAAGRVPRRRFEERRRLAAERLVLEDGADGARADGLLGEEVGGSHQDADLHATRGERRRERGHHAGRACVVDAAGEQHAHVAQRLAREQLLDHRLPEDEARTGADVAAALSPFEDEASRPLFQEHVEEARRGDVKERRDPRLLERLRLRGATARDERDRGAHLFEERELLVAEIGRQETEDADPPRAIAEARAGLFEECLALRRRA